MKLRKKIMFGMLLFLVLAITINSADAIGETKEFYKTPEPEHIIIKDWLQNVTKVSLLEYGCTSPISCYAILEYENYQDITPKHKSLFDENYDWEFYTPYKQYDMDYKFQIEKEITEDVISTIKENCTTEEITHPNSSVQHIETCDHRDIIEQRTKKVWQDYDYFDTKMLKGTNKIKVIAKRPLNAEIEFIPVIHNVKVNEWAWWNDSWSYKREINITGGATALTNFTAFVKLTYADNLDANSNTSLRFLNSSESGELDFDIDYINSSEIGVWVKIPELNPGEANNTIYVYYGNAAASSGESVATWSDYAAVWHFQQDWLDETSNNRDLTNYTATSPTYSSAGAFGGAYDYETETGVELYNNTAFTTYDFSVSTISIWANTTAGWCVDGGGAGDDYMMSISKDGSNYFEPRTTGGTFDNVIREGGTLATDRVASCAAFTNNSEYNHILWSSTGANRIFMYVNGINVSDINLDKDFPASAATHFILGSYGGGIQSWFGKMDEFRIYNTNQSADWALREYQNINMSKFAIGDETIGANFSVTLNSPANAYETNSTTIDFNCTGEAGANNVENITLQIWNSTSYLLYSNTTIPGVVQNYTIYETVTGLPEGTNKWNCLLYDDLGANTTAAANRTFTIDATEPIIIILLPEANYWFNNTNTSLNYSASDAGVGLDTCWYSLNGGANTTIASCDNTTFLMTENTTNSIRVYANDSVGNIGNSSLKNFDHFSIISQSYPATTLEGSAEAFGIALQLNTSRTMPIANITFNNTEYASTGTSLGSLRTYNQTITMPNIDVDINKSHYWNLSWTPVSYISPSYNTTIYHFEISNCTIGTPAIVYSHKDEENRGDLNGTMEVMFESVLFESFNFTFGESINHTVCIYPNSTNASLTFSMAEYNVDGYNQRNYYLSNTFLDNITDYIDIYSLSNSTDILIRVVDTSKDGLSNHIGNIQRYDIGLDTYRTIAMFRTDYDGYDTVPLSYNGAWYRYIVYDETGQLVLITEPAKVKDTDLLLTVYDEDIFLEKYTELQGVYNLLTFNETTNITRFEVLDPSGYSSAACLEIYRSDFDAQSLAYLSCDTGAAVTIVYNMTSEPGKHYVAKGSINGSGEYALTEIDINLRDWFWNFGSDFNTTGLAITLLIVGSIALAGIFNPVVSVFLGVIALAVMTMLGLMSISWTAIVTLAVIAGVIAWFSKRS